MASVSTAQRRIRAHCAGAFAHRHLRTAGGGCVCVGGKGGQLDRNSRVAAGGAGRRAGTGGADQLLEIIPTIVTLVFVDRHRRASLNFNSQYNAISLRRGWRGWRPRRRAGSLARNASLAVFGAVVPADKRWRPAPPSAGREAVSPPANRHVRRLQTGAKPPQPRRIHLQAGDI